MQQSCRDSAVCQLGFVVFAGRRAEHAKRGTTQFNALLARTFSLRD